MPSARLAGEVAGEPAVAERGEAEVIDQVAGGEARVRVTAASHEPGELAADRVTAAEEGAELAEQVSDVAQGTGGEGEGFRLRGFFRVVGSGHRGLRCAGRCPDAWSTAVIRSWTLR